ncbi:MAG: tRNA (adenosine(37)-N6)-threonylcarbamoyltransferase complex ATPase subunit type 1 TsaE [Bdellovibrionales bacterium]|jgi:tRNA threonylcarbamoyl adenosine modification protein YjeE|nr:tRNA (adenosine(37)-N6)-threonylcarbamoyltransferase complex ATPase subunit type 1 TsaE [Bdellovibrionales bacterium]
MRKAFTLEKPTLQELQAFARKWARSEAHRARPTLVFLDGRMGAGKTSFVVSVAEALGAPDAASPSFALHTRYEGDLGIVDHLDLDRLESMDDLESIGFWDLIQAAKSEGGKGIGRFVMIEWATRLEEFGAGAYGAPWTSGFQVDSLKFSGPPDWTVNLLSTSSHEDF